MRAIVLTFALLFAAPAAAQTSQPVEPQSRDITFWNYENWVMVMLASGVGRDTAFADFPWRYDPNEFQELRINEAAQHAVYNASRAYVGDKWRLVFNALTKLPRYDFKKDTYTFCLPGGWTFPGGNGGVERTGVLDDGDLRIMYPDDLENIRKVDACEHNLSVKNAITGRSTSLQFTGTEITISFTSIDDAEVFLLSFGDPRERRVEIRLTCLLENFEVDDSHPYGECQFESLDIGGQNNPFLYEVRYDPETRSWKQAIDLIR